MEIVLVGEVGAGIFGFENQGFDQCRYGSCWRKSVEGGEPVDQLEQALRLVAGGGWIWFEFGSVLRGGRREIFGNQLRDRLCSMEGGFFRGGFGFGEAGEILGGLKEVVGGGFGWLLIRRKFGAYFIGFLAQPVGFGEAMRRQFNQLIDRPKNVRAFLREFAN